MAFQATVIAPISLKPGINIDEGEGAQMLAYGLKTISEQPGFQDCFYGLQLEHPDMLDLLMGRIDHSSLLLTCSRGIQTGIQWTITSDLRTPPNTTLSCRSWEKVSSLARPTCITSA